MNERSLNQTKILNARKCWKLSNCLRSTDIALVGLLENEHFFTLINYMQTASFLP